MLRKSARTWAVVAAAAITVAATLTVTAYAQAGDFSDELTFDIDCDGERDAVAGLPYVSVSGDEAAGVVRVKYSSTGETAEISQASPGVPGSPEPEDDFGTAVDSFDENGDGCDDLVVSAHQEDVIGNDGENHPNAGMIWVIPGSPAGLDTEASRGVNFDRPGVPGSLGVNQYFGERLDAQTSAEGSYVIASMAATDNSPEVMYFLRGDEAYRISQDSPGVSGTTEPGDYFGRTFSAGARYFTIGAPGETIDGREGAGMAHVFSLEAVNGTLRQIGALHQDTPGVSGVVESGDGFGSALSVVPYQAEPGGAIVPLLSVGVSGEDFGTDAAGVESGTAHLITLPKPGTYRQITSANENTPGFPGDAAKTSRFGAGTVLVPRSESGIATPSTTRWVVSGGWEAVEDENYFTELYVLTADAEPGRDAVMLAGDDHGLPLDEPNTGCPPHADTKYLYCDSPPLLGVPWTTILDGASDPTEYYTVD